MSDLSSVWTVLLDDGGGGWVMGVFTSREKAIATISTYEEQQGISLTWRHQDHGHYSEARGHGENRFIVTNYPLDEMGV